MYIYDLCIPSHYDIRIINITVRRLEALQINNKTRQLICLNELRHVWKFVKMYSHKAVDTFDQFLDNYVLNDVAPNVTHN